MTKKMLRIISLLAATLLMAACETITNLNSTSDSSQNSNSPSSTAETSSSVAESNSRPCPKEEIPTALKASFGNYRLAQEGDFIKAIRNYRDSEFPQKQFTCTIFAADFNDDGKKDYAFLLVDPKTFKSEFRIAIATADGKYNSDALRTYDRPPKPIEGAIYTAMFFKASGELGLAQRKYFPLVRGTPERTTFVANPAIELWRPFIPNTPRAVKANPTNYDIDRLAYCSETFYFVEGQLQTSVVCD